MKGDDMQSYSIKSDDMQSHCMKGVHLNSPLSKSNAQVQHSSDDDDCLCLKLLPQDSRDKPVYVNAQVDDYNHLKRQDFKHRPPLRFCFEAKWQGSPSGTTGIGFWNDPFMMTGWRMPTLPQALWFFYEPEGSKLSFLDEPHPSGVKAMVVQAKRWTFIVTGLLWFLTWPLCLFSRYRRWMGSALHRSCQILNLPVQNVHHTHSPMQWHRYKIDWREESIEFYVDDRSIAKHPCRMLQAQGLVVWIDNQVASISPSGALRWFNRNIDDEQSLHIKNMNITSIPSSAKNS